MLLSALYTIAFLLHGYLRWVILLLFVLLIGALLIAYRKCRVAPGSDMDSSQCKYGIRKLSLLLTLAVDLMAVLGLFLFVNYAKVRDARLGDVDFRKRLMEHAPAMILVVVLVHIASVVHKRRKGGVDAWRRYRTMLILYGIALLLIVALMPAWSFRA